MADAKTEDRADNRGWMEGSRWVTPVALRRLLVLATVWPDIRVVVRYTTGRWFYHVDAPLKWSNFLYDIVEMPPSTEDEPPSSDARLTDSETGTATGSATNNSSSSEARSPVPAPQDTHDGE